MEISEIMIPFLTLQVVCLEHRVEKGGIFHAVIFTLSLESIVLLLLFDSVY